MIPTVHTKIAAAFVAAQAELKSITKDRENPHYKFRYATLDAIVEALRPVLAAHGLGVMQTTDLSSDGKTLVVHTTVVHETGEVFGSSVPVPIVKTDPQGVGSALTYGRRYSLAALFCLATDDDDDGNAASKPPAAKPPAQRAPRPRPAPTETHKPASVHDVLFKGKSGQPRRLGDIPTDELKRILSWARENGRDIIADDVGEVLNDRALGNDADSAIARMHASAEKESEGLPFK